MINAEKIYTNDLLEKQVHEETVELFLDQSQEWLMFAIFVWTYLCEREKTVSDIRRSSFMLIDRAVKQQIRHYIREPWCRFSASCGAGSLLSGEVYQCRQPFRAYAEEQLSQRRNGRSREVEREYAKDLGWRCRSQRLARFPEMNW